MSFDGPGEEGQKRWCRNNAEIRRSKGRSGDTEDIIKSNEYKDDFG